MEGSPRREERLHPLHDDALVVDDSDASTRQCRGVLRECWSRAGRRADRRGGRDLDTKTGTLSRLGINMHRVPEQHGEPTNDRKPQAHTLATMARRVVDLIELLEDALALAHWDANTRVPDLEHQASGVTACSDDHAFTRGVADRIRGEIRQDPLQQQRIAVDPCACGDDREAQTLRRRKRTELAVQPLEHRCKRKCRAFGRDRPCIELGDVHQGAEQAFERFDRGVDAADEITHLHVLRTCRECGREQAHRVQRLTQIVARRRQKLRLAPVGRLGGSASTIGGRGLGLKLVDEIDVLVPDRQRLRHQVIEVVTEAQDEAEHDEQHRCNERVQLIALERDAADQRCQRRQRETVEGRLVHRGQVDAAHDHPEQADDQQRLVADVTRYEPEHTGRAPQRPGDG